MTHPNGFYRQSVECTGERFGHWTVLRRAGTAGDSATWYCRDERDGSERIVTRQELRRCKVRAERRKAVAG